VALLPPVPNGVDTDLYQPAAAKQDYALVLGRVAPEKGFHHALDAAIRADVPLIAAGTLFPYPAHQRYFEEQVRPRLDDRRRWHGPAFGAAKRRLLAEARCLLVPSTAPETSSLVAMEALASGTPVIAFRSGALPTIVEHGVTGFIVDDADQMANAIGRVDAIDPAACHRAACARFALSDTIARYFDLYRRLTA
jgi:glycosyltransferase involved in cell wall biosynthesis